MQSIIDVKEMRGPSRQDDVSDPGIGEQVERYRAWLAAQVVQNEDDRLRTAQAYAERASRIVEVEGRRIQTFAPFRYKYSALQTITSKQIVALLMIGLAITLGLIWDWHQTAVAIMIVVALGYMLHLILDVSLAVKAVRHSAEERIDDAVISALHDAEWPDYTILCPLYREAMVVPQFVKAMQALDYPADKLQIMFLTEADDDETRAAIRALHLPPHFQIITVPDGSPRTKPRACNYGLMEATGRYVVIYDAEDVPDPLQLKKTVLTFANHGPNLACVQAKLNFYNPSQNLLTRWFTAEYSLWFDLILPGLQLMKLAIPLGGTSNHFPTQTLRALGGWDGFNVTEDCDLGLRLAWFRLETLVLDSTTYEEANSRFKNWIRQRSRWIKGYMQTYLVHMREPMHYLRQGRMREFLSLQLVIGGKAGVLLINPVMWLMLILSFVFRSLAGEIYGNLIPLPILIVSTICLVAGNFFYIYIYLLACMKREQYHLVKWMLLIPLYWLMASIAAGMALYQLITKPHYWEKTVHGLHLQHTVEQATTPEEIVALAEELPFVPLPMEPQQTPVQKYSRLEAVPVASVQDTIQEMIKPQKPAFSSAERIALHNIQAQQKQDFWSIAVFVIACLVSLISYQYSVHNHIVHALTQTPITQSILPALFSSSPLHQAQFPLPYFVMTLLTSLWQSELVRTIPSMICYVTAACYVFALARRLTRNSPISAITTLLFLLNPSLLFLQSFPLGDMLSMATSLMISYYLPAWVQESRLSFLLSMAASTLLAVLSSSIGWVLFPFLLVLMIGIGLTKRQPWAQIEGSVLVYGLLGGLGIAICLLWNTQTPLSFVQSVLSPFAVTSLTNLHFWQTLPDEVWRSRTSLVTILASLGLCAAGISLLIPRSLSEKLAVLTLFIPFGLSFLALYNWSILTHLIPRTLLQLAEMQSGTLLAPVAATFITALAVSFRHREEVALEGEKA